MSISFVNKYRRLSAFTIIELLVVLIIIGIILSLSGIQYSVSRKHARDALRVSHLQQYAAVLEQSALLSQGRYPKSGGAGDISCADQIVFPSGITLSQFTNGIAPKDPFPFSTTISCNADAQGGYRYHTQYQLSAASQAVVTKHTYILETLLELERDTDTNILQTPAELGGNLPAVDATSGRSRYFLAGIYCSTMPCYK